LFPRRQEQTRKEGQEDRSGWRWKQPKRPPPPERLAFEDLSDFQRSGPEGRKSLKAFDKRLPARAKSVLPPQDVIQDSTGSPRGERPKSVAEPPPVGREATFTSFTDSPLRPSRPRPFPRVIPPRRSRRGVLSGVLAVVAVWAARFREGLVPERHVKAESVKGRLTARHHRRPLTLSGASPISGSPRTARFPPRRLPRGSSKAWARGRRNGEPPFVLPGRRSSIPSPGPGGREPYTAD
jgi:hypothetical protein